MGELGNKINVNLDKFLPALEVFAGKGPVDALKKELGDYGIKGETSVYAGPHEKDGEIVLKYNIDGVPGMIRFNASGAIYEGLKGKTPVAGVPSNLAEYFIGGLFGSAEIPNVADEGDAVIQKALQSAASCWESNGKCDMGKLRETKSSLDQAAVAKQRIDAENAAAERAERQRTNAAAATVNSKRTEMQSYVDRFNSLKSKIYSTSDLTAATFTLDEAMVQNPRTAEEMDKNIRILRAKITIAENLRAREGVDENQKKSQQLAAEIKKDQPWYKTMFTEGAERAIANGKASEGSTARSKYCAWQKIVGVLEAIRNLLGNFNDSEKCLSGHVGSQCTGQYGIADACKWQDVYVCDNREPKYDVSEKDINNAIGSGWAPTESCTIE